MTTTHRQGRCEPVRVLWAAVLQKAIFDYIKYKDSSTSRLDFRTAERFLFSDDGGLIDVCQALDWPLQAMRERAKAMTRSDIHKMEFRERGPRLAHNELVVDGNS